MNHANAWSHFTKCAAGLALGASLLTSVSALAKDARSCEGIFKQERSRMREKARVAAKESPTMDTLRVAAVQFPLAEGMSPEHLLSKIDGYLLEAKKNGAQLVVFPELITTELVNWQAAEGDLPQLDRIAREFTPRYKDWLSKRAQELNLSILGGTTPRIEGDKTVNTAYLAMPDGRVHEQDKLFMTPDEKDWNWTPGSALKVIDAPWGRTAITICFDCEFPRVSNMLAKFKPEILLVPSWTGTHGGLNRVDWSSRGHAVSQYAFVVKTGTVAAEGATQPHFGQASIITPQENGWPTQPIDGEMNKPGIIYGDLDMRKLREMKAASGYYPGKEQEARRSLIRIENAE